LNQTDMASKIQTLKGELDGAIDEGGDNFSLGEKQLLCLARALLRNNKVLFLDEATASVDNETDSLIRKTIKEAFASSTIFYVAHRINTVLECDRVMVVDQGEIVEFDSPSVLQSRAGSQFARLLEESGANALQAENTE